MQYITYQEYLSIGGICDSTAFARNIVRATGIIDEQTFERVQKMEETPVQVKHLCRDLIELFARHNTSDTVITSRSQSAGAVSESESYATMTQDELDGSVDRLVYDYLASVSDDNGTPLLYRGVR